MKHLWPRFSAARPFPGAAVRRTVAAGLIAMLALAPAVGHSSPGSLGSHAFAGGAQRIGANALCGALPAGAVSWWPGDGDAADILDGNAGALYNGATFASGTVGSAFTFDGSDDYASAADAPSLRPASLTVEGWFDYTTTGGAPRVLMGKTLGTGTLESFVVFQNGASLNAVICDLAGYGPFLSVPFAPVNGSWYHIAYTFDDAGDLQALYINGALVASGVVTKSIVYDTHPFVMGAEYDNEGLAYFFHGQIDEMTLFSRALSASEIQAIHAAGSAGKCRPNHPPVLEPIGNLSVDEGAALVFTAVATDPNVPADGLTYSLDPVAVAGAGIDSGTGAFSWTPTEADGPGDYVVTVRVTDDGSPPQEDSETITIHVGELNEAPMLADIGDASADEGSALTFVASASDPDLPANGLTFSLDPGFPPGAFIHPTTGAFSWTPSEAQGPGDYAVTIRVADDGSPPRGDFESIAIHVGEVNSPPTLTFPCTGLPEGAVAWWPGEGDASDVVDGNDGSLLGGAGFASGVVAQTFALDGSNDFVSVPDAPALRPTSLTIEGWFSFSAVPGTDLMLAAKTLGSGTLESFGIFQRGSTLYGVTSNASGYGPFLGVPFVPALGAWYHIAFTFDDVTNIQALYIDGVPMGSQAVFQSVDYDTHPLTIGAEYENDSPAYFFPGRIDEVTLYDRALSAAEIQGIHGAASAGKCRPDQVFAVDEGTTIGFTATAIDVDTPATQLAFSIDSGAPAGASMVAGSGAFSWATGEADGPGDYPVTIRVTDSGDPARDDFETIHIHVREVNQAPVLTVPGAQAASPNAPLTFATSGTDADLPSNPLSFSLMAPSPGDASIDAGTGQVSWTPLAAGSYVIRIVVTDGAGGSDSADVAVAVTSLALNVAITSPSSGAVFPVGTAVTFAGTFGGDGPGRTHVAQWTFDASAQNGVVNELAGTVTATRTFTEAGVYLVRLTVTNDLGATGTATEVGGMDAMIVVYDPAGGFATGGGWFHSPPGAYLADTTLTGKASFGFVSKYQRGASVPTGETEFQFKAANFGFKSTLYEWLVVSGARAQFRGNGSVNGVTGYSFTLTATDGDLVGGGAPDRLRIKIWNAASGGITYDNQRGASDSSDPVTTLGGGSIVVHQPPGGRGTMPAAAQFVPTAFALHAPFPNPSRAGAALTLDLPEAAEVTASVFDLTGREVERLQTGVLPAGRHELRWAATDRAGRRVTAGMYFVRVTSVREGDPVRSAVRKLIVQ